MWAQLYHLMFSTFLINGTLTLEGYWKVSVICVQYSFVSNKNVIRDLIVKVAESAVMGAHCSPDRQ